MRARNKLNVKQVASLRNPGVYSDGGGLYVRVRASGSRSWLFIYSLDNVRREMGLGSAVDVSLAKARERASAARQLIVDGIDPLEERRTAKAQEPVRIITFGEFALELIDSIEGGFKNVKHRAQWRAP